MISNEQPAPTDFVEPRRRALDAAIEGLYSTFAAHKLHGPIVGCPCCTSSADGEQLTAKPLCHLNGGNLDRFARKAVTTLGTVDDFKHFLPRLLEIAAYEGTVGTTEFEIVMSKLNYAEWTRWPAGERAAIEQFLTALWHYILSVFPSSPEIDACLCGIGQAAEDMSPFLAA